MALGNILAGLGRAMATPAMRYGKWIGESVPYSIGGWDAAIRDELMARRSPLAQQFGGLAQIISPDYNINRPGQYEETYNPYFYNEEDWGKIAGPGVPITAPISEGIKRGADIGSYAPATGLKGMAAIGGLAGLGETGGDIFTQQGIQEALGKVGLGAGTAAGAYGLLGLAGKAVGGLGGRLGLAGKGVGEEAAEAGSKGVGGFLKGAGKELERKGLGLEIPKTAPGYEDTMLLGDELTGVLGKYGESPGPKGVSSAYRRISNEIGERFKASKFTHNLDELTDRSTKQLILETGMDEGRARGMIEKALKAGTREKTLTAKALGNLKRGLQNAGLKARQNEELGKSVSDKSLSMAISLESIDDVLRSGVPEASQLYQEAAILHKSAPDIVKKAAKAGHFTIGATKVPTFGIPSKVQRLAGKTIGGLGGLAGDVGDLGKFAGQALGKATVPEGIGRGIQQGASRLAGRMAVQGPGDMDLDLGGLGGGLGGGIPQAQAQAPGAAMPEQQGQIASHIAELEQATGMPIRSLEDYDAATQRMGAGGGGIQQQAPAPEVNPQALFMQGMMLSGGDMGGALEYAKFMSEAMGGGGLGEQPDFTQQEQKFVAAGQLADEARGLLEGGGIETGKAAKIKSGVQKFFGSQDPMQTDYYSKLDSARSAAVSALSGANVPPAEYERMAAMIPEPTDEKSIAIQKLKSFTHAMQVYAGTGSISGSNQFGGGLTGQYGYQ